MSPRWLHSSNNMSLQIENSVEPEMGKKKENPSCHPRPAPPTDVWKLQGMRDGRGSSRDGVGARPARCWGTRLGGFSWRRRAEGRGQRKHVRRCREAEILQVDSNEAGIVSDAEPRVLPEHRKQRRRVAHRHTFPEARTTFFRIPGGNADPEEESSREGKCV